MSPHRLMLVTAMLATLLLQAVAVHAVTPDEMLADPALEARARAISQDLRCVVCQNQSIDDSNAPLAKDLRILVRDRLKAGDSDAEAKAFIVARYGNFVLLKPPMQLNTALLWLAPLLLLVAVLFGLLRYLRHQQGLVPDAADSSVPTSTSPDNDLTADERERLRQILEKGSAS